MFLHMPLSLLLLRLENLDKLNCQTMNPRLNKTEGRLSRSLVRLRRTEGGPVGAHQFGCVATQGFVKPELVGSQAK
jgi:hypothetical protein